MIEFNNKYRSQQREIMDDLDFQGIEMQNNLEDIRVINKWFGGNKITLHGLQKLLKDQPKSKEITILDVGCGDGEMLRICADFAKREKFLFKCVGIDFNPNILELAEAKSKAYSNLIFQKVDVFLEANLIPNCDIALCTLFLHHFKEDEIEILLKNILTQTKKGLIINDLHRNLLAFSMFRLLSSVLLKTKTAHHDGLVSIARGFKKSELEAIANKIPQQNSIINWRWAFRFEWIMVKMRK